MASSSSTTTLGIDPGLSGGIAVISGGRVVLAVPMPTVVVSSGSRKLRMADGVALAAMLDPGTLGIPAIDRVVIEEAYGRRGDGPGGAFTFGGCWWVVFDRIRHLDPIIVPPKRWQKAMLSPFRAMVPEWKGGIVGDCLSAGVRLSPRERNKAASVLYCRQFHPSVNLLPGRTKNPHDGVADAVVIADWGAMQDGPFGGTRPSHPPRTIRRPARGRAKH